MRNGPRGETLAFVILSQSGRNQRQSTLKKIQDCYRHYRGEFWLTKKGIHLLRYEEPCDIWETFEFMSGLGFKLHGVPKNRNLQCYRHPQLINSKWGNIQFVDRSFLVNGAGQRITKGVLKSEIKKQCWRMI